MKEDKRNNMDKASKRGEDKDDQIYVWQGYTGKVELISFKTFLTKPVWKVALGGDHSLILTYDDCLFTCGNNEHGQLGVPEFGREYSFDPCLVESLSGKGIRDIACGTNHSGCISKDGDLFCWGANEHGQCGADPAQHKTIISPSQVQLSSPEMICEHGVLSPEATEHVCQVSCGAQHSVALSAMDKVWVWGSGPQLGLGDVHETWKPTLVKHLLGKKVIQIASGDFHNVLLVEEMDIAQKQALQNQSGKRLELSDTKVHKTLPSTCAKCNSDILTHIENNDSCIIIDNHFCKDEDQAAEGKAAVKASQTTKVLEKPVEKAVTDAKTAEDVVKTKQDKTDVDKVTGDKGTDDTVSKDVAQEKQHNVDTETGDKEDVTKAEDVSSNAVGSVVDQANATSEVLESDQGMSTSENAVSRDDAIQDKSADESFEHSVLSSMVEQNDIVNYKKNEASAIPETDKVVLAEVSETDKEDFPEVFESGKKEVEMRRNNERNIEDMLPLSIRSDTSMMSSISGKSRSKSFIDETGAREYLAKQFQDDDLEPLSRTKLLKIHEPARADATQPKPSPSSPGAYMMQTMTSLTNQVTSVTSQVTSMTTKALGNIVPASLRFSTSGVVGEEDTQSSTETLDVSEISELEGGSSENINLDNSTLDLSNLMTLSDNSVNTSLLSLPDSETSLDQELTPESSPVKERKSQSGRKSVSKESQSIRTIEAKQENLRKSSLSLPVAEEQKKLHKPKYTMDTELWVWGKNSKGQLGLGDMLDRHEPFCIQILSGKRVVKVACGAQHNVVLTSTGEVYSWGLNLSGQLGHSEMSSSPAKIELTYDCCVWDLDAGSNHSIFLMDNASTQGSKPDVFYAGKHPCKDLYVPIYKTPRLTPLNFLRKAGWIRSVATGGDNCACVSRLETESTQMMFDVTRFVRQVYRQLHKVIQVYLKRLQISGFYTSLDVFPFKPMMSSVMTSFTNLTKKIGVGSLEMTDLLRQGDTILAASIFTQYDEYITEFRKYSAAFADMVAVGGFEYCTKTGSSTFDNLQEVYIELLQTTKAEDKSNHAAMFRLIMFTPLDCLKDLSKTIHNFSNLFEKPAKEHNLLSSVHLNLEHVIRTSSKAITDAENTRAFWEVSSSKISDSLRTPNRRLIKESKSSPLTLSGAGRFSTHTFYLFNDLFIRSQGSTYQSYPLKTVWIDTPTSESSSHQHMITVTTPEDVLSLNAHAAQVKTEWVVAFNTAINKVLAKQKSVSRQNSGERVHTPVIRLASHTFTKLGFKDAIYKGYWLNGKVHGSGVLTWADGRRFRGKFKHGTQTGYGRLSIPKENKTEEVQEGQWKDGKLHGHGNIKYSTGDLYDGYFKDGQRHGHGVYRKGRYLNSASFVYVGEWMYDKKHGYGVMDDILKGEKYMGMWQEDVRHGDGVVVTLDGMYFEGNFQYDKLVGFGLMLTDDNSCYEGEFAGITMLQGKGTLTFPVGDKIEGTFSGTWNEGLKLSGTFLKMSMTASMERRSPSRTSLESKSSLYGKLCVRPERKWEEIFYQCYDSLHYSGQGQPNISKAWDQVVACIMAGKQSLREKDRKDLSSKQKLELSNLDQLEKVPTHGVDILCIEQYSYIVEYLKKAFETRAHPLGTLIEELVNVFRAAYIGIGAHPRLLYHAIQEIQSFIRRIFNVIRILFPELPASGGPAHVYPERSRRPCTSLNENMGFIQRQISETSQVDEDLSVQVVSAAGILQSILLPKIYPALFDLYALYSDRDDEKYWERVQKLNKLGDMSLMAYLGIDQGFWCIDDAMYQDKHKRLSSLKDHCYSKAVEFLQQLSTAFCPEDKLGVIEKTFLAITQAVQEFLGEEHVWCMDDLFPIFQFVVLRAKIHHLGAEIHFIEDLMESHLEFGEHGIMFTTLKASYYQIQNEKMPIH